MWVCSLIIAKAVFCILSMFLDSCIVNPGCHSEENVGGTSEVNLKACRQEELERASQGLEDQGLGEILENV